MGEVETLIVYESVHHGNTEKIARAMADVLHAELRRSTEVAVSDLARCARIGFGSGIYFLRHHRRLLDLAKSLPPCTKPVFVCSTRGGFPMWVGHRALKRLLRRKGCVLVGEFSCKGYDSYGLLKPIGGIHRGRPDAGDIERAEAFARGLP